jgi:membrane-associated phospholipid phosphatase
MSKNLRILAARPIRGHPALAFKLALALVAAVSACTEPTTSVVANAPVQQVSAKFWEVGSSVSWNQTARALIVSRAVTAPIAQVRIMTYLSVAQYNAVVAAENEKDGSDHASPAAAAAGASLIVLKSFFPLDVASLDAKILAQRAATPWSGEANKDFAAGETIGRAIGAQVVAYAATDNSNLTTPPVNPGGPGKWIGTNPIRGLYGTRTLALTSGDQFRPPPPPAFGSAEFNAAVAEERAITDALTPAQLAIVQLWAPRGPAFMNQVASDMIVAYHRNEREAARILAVANMAGFDVSNACFDAKFAYYLIRPSQADPLVHLSIPLPNHPSYPSGHSCITSAYATVLGNIFPDETEILQAMVVEAGRSRNYGGLHYVFDCIVGQELGRNVANYVLSVAPAGHSPIPLD